LPNDLFVEPVEPMPFRLQKGEEHLEVGIVGGGD
jgi:hypothetical protein